MEPTQIINTYVLSEKLLKEKLGISPNDKIISITKSIDQMSQEIIIQTQSGEDLTKLQKHKLGY